MSEEIGALDALDKLTREVLECTHPVIFETPTGHCHCHEIDFPLEEGCELCHENPTDCIDWFVNVFTHMDKNERIEKYGWSTTRP